MKFVSPRNDVAFKKIFGNEDKKEILISFLNAVLILSGEKEIQNIEILNPWQAPRLKELKYTLLDVKARDRRGITFIVEMQMERVAGLRKRFAYYAAKAYSSQIERGEDYPKLNQVIFIGILDFTEFSGEHYLTRHILLNTETYQHELNDFEFNFIELSKFYKKENELETVLEKWIYFIKQAENLDVIPANADIPALQEAWNIANRFGWSKEELELYDYWGMKAQDERGKIQVAFQKGEQKKAFETAKNLLAMGVLTIEQIAQATGLNEEEIRIISS